MNALVKKQENFLYAPLMPWSLLFIFAKDLDKLCIVLITAPE